MNGLIYKIANNINEKIYIGRTKRLLEVRIKEHKRNSKYKKYPIYRAIRKYGWDSFIVEVLEDNIPLENLNERELYWTNKFNALAPNGYVLRAGEKSSIFSKYTETLTTLSIPLSASSKSVLRFDKTCLV